MEGKSRNGKCGGKFSRDTLYTYRAVNRDGDFSARTPASFGHLGKEVTFSCAERSVFINNLCITTIIAVTISYF